MKKVILAILTLALLVGLGVLTWKWGVCYRWCARGESLLVQRKTGNERAMNQYAKEGEKGVMEQMLGPGRYLHLDPYNYSVTRARDIEVPPGKICVVKNNIGKALPEGRFLAGPDEKGTQKQVLTPGRWRINSYGTEVKDPEDATIIKPGYVGVQTLREGENKGILDRVLQAGYYNINPTEIRVDQVEIGYRVWDITIEYETTTTIKDGRRVQVKGIRGDSGVSFPLADGKQMHLDFTVVWGIFPENAPRIVREYGTVEMVEQKIIEPQVLSICKNAGSNLTTQQFIEGETREEFQNAVTEALKEMGKEKGINFLIALVRGFHPAEDIKITIQARLLAQEEKKTLLVEQQRETVAASLEEAQKIVDIAVHDFDAETEALVQEEYEVGLKKAAETRAEADRIVAELQKQTAEIQAKMVKIAGQAEADVVEAIKKAEATKLQLLIDAYGGAESYNLATFAESLPEDFQIEYRYAGEGTLWTDMKSGFVETAARKALSARRKK